MKRLIVAVGVTALCVMSAAAQDAPPKKDGEHKQGTPGQGQGQKPAGTPQGQPKAAPAQPAPAKTAPAPAQAPAAAKPVQAAPAPAAPAPARPVQAAPAPAVVPKAGQIPGQPPAATATQMPRFEQGRPQGGPPPQERGPIVLLPLPQIEFRKTHGYSERRHAYCQEKAWQLVQFERHAAADGYLSRSERATIRDLKDALDDKCEGYRWRD